MYTQDPSLIAYLNEMHPDHFKEYISRNDKLQQYIQDTGYQHPSGGTLPITSSNLGLGNAPTNEIVSPYGTGTVSAGGQFLTPTPAAPDTGQSYYPYAGDVTPEQFTFQPQDFAIGSGAEGTLPQYAPEQMIDPTWGAEASASPGLLASGTETAAAEGAAEAGGSAWGGPATFAGNMALNMIPTRDKEKVDTPFGDEGSMSGIAKGMGKGALLGGTVSGGNPYAIAGGAVLGAFGGAGGYFDSTSPPQVSISRIIRGKGVPTGGGLMYA